MPSLNFDPHFRGDGLDVMLHDPTHPVRLLAFHLCAGEDVIAVFGIRSLPTPSEQFFDQHHPEGCSFSKLIVGLQQIIERAHQHGIRVFGATLTPYEGADYYSEDGESTRQAVNQWIRTDGAFDWVIDFDAAVRDPSHPGQFREGYHSGDHLHPSAMGYKAMANAVDLTMLKRAATSSTKK